ELRVTADLLEHRLDARAILLERRAADLHLHHGVAAIEIAAHLRAQLGEVLPRIIVAARGIDEDFGVGGCAVALGKEAEQRLAGDLRHRVPYRHVDGADRDRALAMAARLLVRLQHGPDLVRIEVVATGIEKRLRIGLEHAAAKALADETALAVAAVGIEAVADDRLAVAHDAGDHRDQARGHLGEVDIGVADGRGDRLGDLTQVDDTDAHSRLQERCRGLSRSGGLGNLLRRYTPGRLNRRVSPSSKVMNSCSPMPSAASAAARSRFGCSKASAVSWKVPKCMPMLSRAPRSRCARTASAGYMCTGVMNQRGS